MASMGCTYADCLQMSGIANMYAMGYMLYPSDDSGRDRFHALVLAGLARHGGGELDAEVLQVVIEAARCGGLEYDAQTVPGCVAADVLLSALAMAANGIENAGIEKAIFLVSQLYPHFRNAEGKGYTSISERTIQRHWAAMRPAAHLWAAWLVLVRDAQARGLQDEAMVLHVGASPALLPIAQGFLELAAAHKAPRSAEPLLGPAECWVMEGIPAPPPMAAPALTSFELEVLERHSPRGRR